MLGEEMSPLDVVRYELWRNTDRNPADAGAVMDMIQEAVDTLGDKAEEFTQRLTEVLDPYNSRHLGVAGASRIEAMAGLVGDQTAARVERWGALSLLGVLAITHNPNLTDEEIMANSALRSSHIAGYVARGALLGIQYSHTEEPYRTVAEALLAHEGFAPEDVATELVVHGFNGEQKPANRTDKTATPDLDPTLACGSAISEPYEYSLPKTSVAESKLRAMDWLSDTDPAVEARDILHDGQKAATVVDLTDRHTVLKTLRDEAVQDPKQGAQFWPQVGNTIAQYTITGGSNRLHGTKVPTFYMKNMAGSNGNVVRAYFTTLGNDADGVPVIALIGACRTKGNEARVHRIICRSSKHKMTEV